MRSPEEITPQHVSELEINLEEYLGQVVQLDMVNLRVIEPFSEGENTVFSSLETQFPNARITDISLSQQGTNLRVDVTLRTANPVTIEDVKQAESTLAETLGQAVRLYVIVQEVIAVPEARPEMTPEATAEPRD